MEPIIVWFRRDLRLEDNPALVAAARLGPIIPLFIWCPEEEGQFQPGRLSRWWLKQSLLHLNDSLVSLGAPLIARNSLDSLTTLLEIAARSGAKQVFYNHLYDPISLVRDQRIRKGLMENGLTVHSFNGDLLYEPWEVYDENGQAFTTFDAYWEKCLTMPYEPDAPLLPPFRLIPFSGNLESSSPTNLGLENLSEISSNALLSRTWAPGWSNADAALETFLSGPLINYATNRKKTDSTTTSLLSPHLHFGEISIRKVFHSVRRKQITWIKDGREDGQQSVKYFLRAIGFREYSRYLSFTFPFTHERPLLANLKSFPWRNDDSFFKAWRQGRTGYPLVDAGMRELWATGWLHNRIRVVVSSFCVKFLQLPWRWGMKYFWDTLLDADLESDVLGWQYISGSLPDGHELDRISNPKDEGYEIDPTGEYVRKWLPELSRLPTEWIHHPWDAPPVVLQSAGVELGCNYPRPIVELATAKERLQLALEEMWRRDVLLKSSRAAAENEEEVCDTEEIISGTGGPLHQKMDVHKAYLKGKRIPCASTTRDQLVPVLSKHKQQAGPSKFPQQRVDPTGIVHSSGSGRSLCMQESDLMEQIPVEMESCSVANSSTSPTLSSARGSTEEANSAKKRGRIMR